MDGENLYNRFQDRPRLSELTEVLHAMTGQAEADIGTMDAEQNPPQVKATLGAREPGRSSKAAKFTSGDDSDEDAEADDESDPEVGFAKMMKKAAARMGHTRKKSEDRPRRNVEAEPSDGGGNRRNETQNSSLRNSGMPFDNQQFQQMFMMMFMKMMNKESGTQGENWAEGEEEAMDGLRSMRACPELGPFTNG